MSNISACDAIFHMTRVLLLLLFVLTCAGAFEDEDVIHVEGDVNPVRDLEIIHNELRLKDLEAVTGLVVCRCCLIDDLVTFVRVPRRRLCREAETTKKPRLSWCVTANITGSDIAQATLKKIKELLESGKDVRFGDWSLDEVGACAIHMTLTAPD